MQKPRGLPLLGYVQWWQQQAKRHPQDVKRSELTASQPTRTMPYLYPDDVREIEKSPITMAKA